MQTFSQLTYETFLAYALPGLTAVSPFLYLMYVTFGEPTGATKITVGLLLVSLVSILLGALIDMAAHVLFAKWRRRKKQAAYWGDAATSRLLEALLQAHYPASADWSQDQRSAVIDSLLIRNVSPHVFSRRNWDYTLHDASRNLLVGTGLFIGGVLVLYTREIIGLVSLLGILVATLFVDYVSLWRYMCWSINQYYGYHVVVALGCLLERGGPPGNSRV